MTSRLPALPTLEEFLKAARDIGCTEKTIRGRQVIENPKLQIPVVLKQMSKNERLTQFYAEYLSRVLGVSGFSAEEFRGSPKWRPSDPEQS